MSDVANSSWRKNKAEKEKREFQSRGGLHFGKSSFGKASGNSITNSGSQERLPGGSSVSA